jgi:hypothetical protein
MAMLFALCTIKPSGAVSMDEPEKLFRTGLTDKEASVAASPDGNQLLFSTNNWLHGLRLLDTRSGKFDVIAVDQGKVWEMPAWSRDGKHVVAVSISIRDNRRNLDDMQLVSVDPKTWRGRAITASHGVKIFPFFSADNKSVYFFKGEIRESGKTPASRYDLYVIDLGSGKERRLTHEGFYQVNRGDDNGMTVLFNATPMAKSVKDAFSSNTAMTLFLYSETTQNVRSLPIQAGEGVFFFISPMRSRSGNLYFLAAKSRPGGGSYLWCLLRAQADGTKPVILRELPISMGFDMARDTNEIFVADRIGEELVVRRLRDSAAR